MGMFDNIDYEMDCPRCGTPMRDFQSKESDCCLEMLSPAKVRHFYSSCDVCYLWVNCETIVESFTVKPTWSDNQSDYRNKEEWEADRLARLAKAEEECALEESIEIRRCQLEEAERFIDGLHD